MGKFMSSTFMRLFISQRIGEYLTGVLLTFAYSLFFDTDFLISYGQEPNLINMVLGALWVWVLMMTISFYLLYILVSYFPYLLFKKNGFLYALSSALLSAVWSILWLWGLQALSVLEGTTPVLWIGIVLAFFFVAKRSFRRCVLANVSG